MKFKEDHKLNIKKLVVNFNYYIVEYNYFKT